MAIPEQVICVRYVSIEPVAQGVGQMVAKVKSKGAISDQLADSRSRETDINEHKVVGCLSLADYDLVTHETVSFALVCRVYPLVQSPSTNYNVCLLADGGHARVGQYSRTPRLTRTTSVRSTVWS